MHLNPNNDTKKSIVFSDSKPLQDQWVILDVLKEKTRSYRRSNAVDTQHNVTHAAACTFSTVDILDIWQGTKNKKFFTTLRP